MPRASVLVLLLVVGTIASATDVVVLLDNSGSMRRNDPERLLKPAVIEMIRRFPADLRISVVSFDGQPTPLIGLSDQSVDLEAALASIDYQGRFTDTPAAVERALYELRDQGHIGARRHVVLVTDGIVDLGDAAASRRAEDWLTGALTNTAVREGIRIHAIAFAEGADFRVLQGITEVTGGRYYRAADIGELKAVLDRIRVVLQRDPSAGLEQPGLEPVQVPDIRPAVALIGHAVPSPTTASSSPMVAAPASTLAAPASTLAAPSSMSAATTAAAPSSVAAAPSPIGPVPSTLRWWVVTLVMFAMVGVAGGAVALTIVLYRRRGGGAVRAVSERLAYFPECHLVDLDGVTPSTRHELKSKRNLISRLKSPPDDGVNYIYIPRPAIGRRHAMIEYRDLSFWIKDLNSVNGTRLNGKRVNTEQSLKHGDRIKFHTYEFEFSVADLTYSNATETAWQRSRG